MRPAPVSRTSLVGRRTELGQFSATLLSCLDSGTGLTIHVRGDPGIGKTRLVEEFREIARKHGFAGRRGAAARARDAALRRQDDPAQRATRADHDPGRDA